MPIPRRVCPHEFCESLLPSLPLQPSHTAALQTQYSFVLRHFPYAPPPFPFISSTGLADCSALTDPQMRQACHVQTTQTALLATRARALGQSHCAPAPQTVLRPPLSKLLESTKETAASGPRWVLCRFASYCQQRFHCSTSASGRLRKCPPSPAATTELHWSTQLHQRDPRPLPP